MQREIKNGMDVVLCHCKNAMGAIYSPSSLFSMIFFLGCSIFEAEDFVAVKITKSTLCPTRPDESKTVFFLMQKKKTKKNPLTLGLFVKMIIFFVTIFQLQIL